MSTALANLERAYAAFTAAAEAVRAEIRAEAGQPADSPTPPAVRTIQAVVAAHYGLTVPQMLGATRRNEITGPRQISMAICRDETGYTAGLIGRAHRRDHGTVLHACRAVANRCETELGFVANYSALQAKVAQAIAQNHPHV
ncbi:MAG TPA: helix-turn-helix domain-containing protein [Opitutaceae bacterium]|nr:helix-turn-helix domain-containing protein [Opitutaceae bacterium]